jgi:branched-chain amino acid transport system permease protein
MSRHAAGALALIAAGLALSFAVPAYGWVNKYQQMILMYVGINIILAASLNLVNGYMGSSPRERRVHGNRGVPASSSPWAAARPLAPAGFRSRCWPAGGGGALRPVVAIPSFKTRGDYLALVTLAFLMIVKSLIENLDVIGGPRGFLGMKRLTTLPWVYAWTVLTLLAIRNFVYSRFGRAVLAVREDEIAAGLMGRYAPPPSSPHAFGVLLRRRGGSRAPAAFIPAGLDIISPPTC